MSKIITNKYAPCQNQFGMRLFFRYMALNIPKFKNTGSNAAVDIDKQIKRHVLEKRDAYKKGSKEWLRVHNALADQLKGYYTHEMQRLLQEDIKRATGEQVLKYRSWLRHLKTAK